MRILRKALGVAALLASLAGPAGGACAAADPLPPASVAVLDYQVILRDSKAVSDIRRQIEAYRQDYQEKVSAEEQGLQAEEAELKRQRTVLSAEAFEERRRRFEEKVIALQRRVQDRTRALDRSFDEAMKNVQEALQVILKDLTEQKGYNLVLDKGQAVYAGEGLDITAEVLQRLDKRLNRVPVPPPQGE